MTPRAEGATGASVPPLDSRSAAGPLATHTGCMGGTWGWGAGNCSATGVRVVGAVVALLLVAAVLVVLARVQVVAAGDRVRSRDSVLRLGAGEGLPARDGGGLHLETKRIRWCLYGQLARARTAGAGRRGLGRSVAHPQDACTDEPDSSFARRCRRVVGRLAGGFCVDDVAAASHAAAASASLATPRRGTCRWSPAGRRRRSPSPAHRLGRRRRSGCSGSRSARQRLLGIDVDLDELELPCPLLDFAFDRGAERAAGASRAAQMATTAARVGVRDVALEGLRCYVHCRSLTREDHLLLLYNYKQGSSYSRRGTHGP